MIVDALPRSTTATAPATKPKNVRVENSLINSALTRAIIVISFRIGEPEENLLEAVGPRGELVENELLTCRNLADVFRREVRDFQTPRVVHIDDRTYRGKSFDQALGLRGAHGHRGRGGEEADSCLGDETPVVDHNHVVGHQRDLGEDVTRYEDSSARRGERSEERTQPPDTSRVEAVCGLVENEEIRIAQQRGGKAEPLPHPERQLAH